MDKTSTTRQINVDVTLEQKRALVLHCIENNITQKKLIGDFIDSLATKTK